MMLCLTASLLLDEFSTYINFFLKKHLKINYYSYFCIQLKTKTMYFIEKTPEFDRWLRKLKNLRAKAKILLRIQKLETEEHFGDCKSVGNGINELKINFAKGYRVYFKEKDGKIVILLIGGDKSTQQKDIQKAKEIWKRINK